MSAHACSSRMVKEMSCLRGWDEQDAAAAVDLGEQPVDALVARRQQAVGRPHLQLYPQRRAVLLRVHQAVQPQPVDSACKMGRVTSSRATSRRSGAAIQKAIDCSASAAALSLYALNTRRTFELLLKRCAQGRRKFQLRTN